MSNRDDGGRFGLANPWAATGGRRRAEVLTPERRREIAALGFAAMCAACYGGDRRAAARGVARAALPADALYYGHTRR